MLEQGMNAPEQQIVPQTPENEPNSIIEAPTNFPPALQMMFDSLNNPQRQAVLTLDGPVLMLAGAGTGKTKALTARLAHILLGHHAHTQEVLAVTFTNKAAKEMRHRVEQILGRSTAGMWLGTFHSISVRILRRYAERVGVEAELHHS